MSSDAVARSGRNQTTPGSNRARLHQSSSPDTGRILSMGIRKARARIEGPGRGAAGVHQHWPKAESGFGGTRLGVCAGRSGIGLRVLDDWCQPFTIPPLLSEPPPAPAFVVLADARMLPYMLQIVQSSAAHRQEAAGCPSKGAPSASGHQRTWRPSLAMSSPPPKADTDQRALNVRFVPCRALQDSAQRGQILRIALPCLGLGFHLDREKFTKRTNR
jgi:hypothetical protein